MIDFIKDINIISSYHTKSKLYAKIQSRKTNGFILKQSGVSEYIINDKNITLSENKMIFLPKGSDYQYTSSPDGMYTSINFDATIDNPEPRVYSLEDFREVNFIHESFSYLFKFGSITDKYKCLSVFYELLSYVSRIENLNRLEKNKYHIIEPAVEYLKTHIFDLNLKIDNLHRLCCISDTYFRNLFIARFNVTPQEYVISKRISQAKSILESGDFDSIEEVSKLVGYKDPLYFSKSFKKIYGFSPSSVIK